MFDPTLYGYNSEHFNVTVRADSIGPNGVRLTTLECTYPDIIHTHVLTHRVFSRNTSSSRAIPTRKLLGRLKNHVLPLVWRRNQRGMSGGEAFDHMQAGRLDFIVDQLVEVTRLSVGELREHKVAKETINRYIEHFLTRTVVITSTEWQNFINLRTASNAQPEVQLLATLVRQTLDTSTPTTLHPLQWHMPFIDAEAAQLPEADRLKVSVGRCARVSYLTHDGERDPMKDIALADRLLADGHMSPFEHVAQCLPPDTFGMRLDGFTVDALLAWKVGFTEAELLTSKLWSGNLRGWRQYRKTIHGESTFTPS
jgi:thymidylate synthase ThyX